MANNKLHPFENAGLGEAPYRFLGVNENWFCVPGVPDSRKPGSSCDYCSTGIAYEFWCESADGKRFKVGCDCIRRCNQKDKFESDVERETHRLQNKLRKESEVLRIEAAKEKLASPEGEESRFALRTHPHPARWQAEQGKTLLDYVEFLLERGGHAGQIRAVRLIKKTKRATDAEITKYREQRNEWDAEAKQAQAKADLEEEARQAVAGGEGNVYLAEELEPHGKWAGPDNPLNFAASIVSDLRSGRTRAQDLPPKAQSIIIDILCKGFRGRLRDQRAAEIESILKGECQRCGGTGYCECEAHAQDDLDAGEHVPDQVDDNRVPDIATENGENPFGDFQEQCESGELAEWERNQEAR